MIDGLLAIRDELAKKVGFKAERIAIFREAEGTYGIDIDNIPWSNCLHGEEVEDQLYCLFKGMELAGMKGE